MKISSIALTSSGASDIRSGRPLRARADILFDPGLDFVKGEVPCQGFWVVGQFDDLLPDFEAPLVIELRAVAADVEMASGGECS